MRLKFSILIFLFSIFNCNSNSNFNPYSTFLFKFNLPFLISNSICNFNFNLPFTNAQVLCILKKLHCQGLKYHRNLSLHIFLKIFLRFYFVIPYSLIRKEVELLPTSGIPTNKCKILLGVIYILPCDGYLWLREWISFLRLL